MRLLFLILLFIAGNSLPGRGQDLPRFMTEAEKELLGAYVPPSVASLSTPRPESRSGSFRAMAEWEELQAVVITWASQQAILAEIVRALQKECRVIIVCNNEGSVKNYLTGKNVDWTDNITFVQGPYNSIWVRDYGPNPVYQNDVDSLFLVDWIYNRPRPNDDLVSFLVGDVLALPVMATQEAPEDLVHTGGNFMSDGLGTGFSSQLVLDENGPFNQFGTSNHDEAAINGIMQSFMGIDVYPKMVNLPFDGIHHIDMHMKLLDEETLLVGQYPEGIADGPQIEANLQFILSSITTRFGTPFKVIRMPMPPDATGKYPHQGGHYRTYTNSLIANHTVIVPTYTPSVDSTALRIYAEAMPGYQIVGINCNAIIPSSGALHCITKEIGVNDPLRIVHQPLKEWEPGLSSLPFRALVQHRDGIQQVNLFWTTDTTQGFTALAMAPGAEPDMWEVDFPALDEEAEIRYYIEATSLTGKVRRRPLTAPSGHWTFMMPGQPTQVALPSLPGIHVEEVFPNPASAITCIPVDFGHYQGGVDISLTDVMGRILPIFRGDVSGGRRQFFFDAGGYPAGTYALRVRAGAFTQARTVLVR